MSFQKIDNKEPGTKRVKLFEFQIHAGIDAYTPEWLLEIAQQKAEKMYPHIETSFIDVLYKEDWNIWKYCEVYLLTGIDFNENDLKALKIEEQEWILEEIE